jgi:hypothetical protein
MAESQESSPQWTGHDLFDLDGNKIGTVEDVRGEADSREPSWLVVETGFLGRKKIMVPAGGVRRSGRRLSVPYTKERVKDAPEVDDEQPLTEAEKGKLCRYYGLQYNSSQVAADGCEEMQDIRPAG